MVQLMNSRLRSTLHLLEVFQRIGLTILTLFAVVLWTEHAVRDEVLYMEEDRRMLLQEIEVLDAEVCGLLVGSGVLNGLLEDQWTSSDCTCA